MIHISVQFIDESFKEILAALFLFVFIVGVFLRQIGRSCEVDCCLRLCAWHICFFLSEIATQIDALVPVETLTDLHKQVNSLTRACKDDDLLILVCIEESQQIEKSILAWDGDIVLFDLFRDRVYDVFIDLTAFTDAFIALFLLLLVILLLILG